MEKRQYSVSEGDGVARVLDDGGSVVIEAATKDEALDELKYLAGPDVEIKDSEPVVKDPEAETEDEVKEEAEEPEEETEEESPAKETPQKTVPQKALHQARQQKKAATDLLAQVQESLTAINQRLAALETRPSKETEPEPEPDPFEGLPEEEYVSVKDIKKVLTARESKVKESTLDMQLNLFASMPKIEGDELTPAQAVGIVRKAFEARPELKSQLAASADPISLVRKTAAQFAILMKLREQQANPQKVDESEEEENPVAKATIKRSKEALDAKKKISPSLGKSGESGEFTDEITSLAVKVQSFPANSVELTDFLAGLPRETRKKLMQHLETEE